MAHDMNAFLILNPTAGQRKLDETRRQIESALRECGLNCEVRLTEQSGDGTTLARRAAESGYDLVIAAGGDGTINEVATGLVGTETPLGILPVGTVNVLARQLGIPLDVRQAVSTLVTGRTKQLDIGCANNRYFTLMAGFGFDAEIVASVLKPLKDAIGALAYVIKGLEMLAKYRATDVILEMPEETYSGRAYLVVVANSPSYAYKLRLAPYASTDDGLLDVIVFEEAAARRIGFIRRIFQVFFRRHVYHQDVRYFKTPRVTVRSFPDVMVQLDGDPNGVTPTEVSIIPHGLTVVVPSD